MTRTQLVIARLLVTAVVLAGVAARPALAIETAVPGRVFKQTYLYNFSTTTGVLPLSGVSLAVDYEANELFTFGDGLVRVFNDAGMEIFQFGTDSGAPMPVSLAPVEGSDFVAIAMKDGERQLARYNFRGEVTSTVTLTGVPEPFLRDFVPDVIRAADGKVYLVHRAKLKLLVVTADGAFVAARDIGPMVEPDPAKRVDLFMRGFNVDRRGNVLFTIADLFRAYVLSPAGELKSFGQKGSAPGKFNVVTGIAADDDGNVYVADILKNAIIVFDNQLRFIREFGYRGRKPGNLAAPEDVVFANGRLYVAQNARKGVSVFKVEWN